MYIYDNVHVYVHVVHVVVHKRWDCLLSCMYCPFSPSISDLKKLIQEHSEALCGLQSQLDNLTLKEPLNVSVMTSHYEHSI